VKMDMLELQVLCSLLKYVTIKEVVVDSGW
jgi:hypothetical protein